MRDPAPPVRSTRRAAFEAPRGARSLLRVLLLLPQLVARRPLAVLGRGLLGAAALELGLRALFGVVGGRGGVGLVGALCLLAVWVGLLLMAARWVADAIAPPAVYAGLGWRRSSRWPLDMAFGLGLVLSLLLGFFVMAIVLQSVWTAPGDSAVGRVSVLVFGLLGLTLPAAVTGAVWMGSTARHLVPESPRGSFPLLAPRFLFAWAITAGCTFAFFVALTDREWASRDGSLLRWLLGQLLPVTVLGVVVAALAELATTRRVEPDIGRVFE